MKKQRSIIGDLSVDPNISTDKADFPLKRYGFQADRESFEILVTKNDDLVDAKYFYNPGLAIVKKKTVWGLVDTPGNFKVNCIYDDIDYNLEELDDATLDFKSRFGNKPIDFWTTSS